MLSKRQFLRAAGIAAAGRMALRAGKPDLGDRKVILVTFGGGVRYSETFAPEGARNIPQLTRLRPEGLFYRTCVNAGVLSHFNSTASIVTGNWQRVDDFGFQPPASRTVFEAFRQQRKAGPMDAWAICTNKSFASIGGSNLEAGANVILPKQLLLEAVKDIVAKPRGMGVADRENVQRRLENILQEGYEGVGWTIFQQGRKLDREVRETLTRALVEYIHGPEAPTSGDELTFFITREVMREFAPRLLLVNFWDMDVAHWGSYSLYLQAITRTDRLVGMLWDEVKTNTAYRDKTTVLILPELGRDGDINAANGFLNHRSGDASCRNMWLLALGAGASKGEVERPVSHIDVAATAASLLGAKLESAGRPLSEIS
jgi:hypothetical protein